MFPDLARFDRVAIDTETTGLGYKNRPVGLSWATPDGQSGYLAWGHDTTTVGSIFDAPADANNCGFEQVREWAAAELTREHQLKVFHNAPFDLRMLAYAGIAVRGRVEDTQVAAPILNELEPAFSLNALSKKYLGREKSDDALNEWCALSFGGRATRKDQAKNYWRAPHHIVGPYAQGDTELTLALYDHLRPLVTAQGLDPIYGLETAIIPIVTEMHLTGVRVDLDAARLLDLDLTTQINALRHTWDELSGGADPGKTAEIVPIFERAGIPVPLRKKGKEATEEEGGKPSIQSEDLEHVAHPLAQCLVKLRRLIHYRDTFVRTYVIANADLSGIIHGEFHALRSDEFGAVSGRFSSGLSDGSLNLQNLPKRNKEFAPQVRGLFVPYHRDWHWLKADYSQIQFRFLAHYAALIGHDALAKAYRANPDIDFHKMCAALTAMPRDDAKHINFGCVFGMGKLKLARKLGRSVTAAERILDEYHSKLPAVRETYDVLQRRANSRGQIITYGGRVRRFPTAADARDRGWVVRSGEQHVGTHKGLNALLQGSEADLVKQALVGLRSVAKDHDALLHLTVHDEFDWSVAPDQLRPFGRQVRELMQDCKLEVPVLADVSYGKDWGHSDQKLVDLAAAA